MGGRVVVVACSPRIPPGLLSWPAWEALRSGPVLTADGAHPQLPYLRDAGVDVTVSTTTTADHLVERASAGKVVVWLSAGTADAELVRALATAATRGGPSVELVQASYDPPGARLLDVVAVMDRLRSPGGCPWDAEQTHTSLMPYLLEESYEAYQALEDGDLVDLREELGDVLLQVVFHARIAAETSWTIDDVAGDLVDKLVRRHPHVFAGGSADDLEGTWEALKLAEKGRASVTDGVPLSQPALLLAAKLQKRAERLGVPVEVVERAGYRAGSSDGTGSADDTVTPTGGDGLGAQLWSLVVRCRAEGVDPEVALRSVARTLRDRLASVEASLAGQGRDPRALTAEQWRTLLA